MDRTTGKRLTTPWSGRDRRTADICERMRECGYSEGILERTGLQIDPYFSVRSQMDPGQRSGCFRAADSGDLVFGTIDKWLMWNHTMSAMNVTDYTNASRTMLFNIRTLQWDEGIVDAVRIPRTFFPDAYPSGHVFGNVDPSLFGISPPIFRVSVISRPHVFGRDARRGDVK